MPSNPSEYQKQYQREYRARKRAEHAKTVDLTEQAIDKEEELTQQVVELVRKHRAEKREIHPWPKNPTEMRKVREQEYNRNHPPGES